MILLASMLTFLSVSLFIIGVTMLRDRTARRRIEKDLLRNTLRELGADESFDDQTLLRDESMSGFGPLHNILKSLRIATNMRRLLEQADIDMRVGTLMLAMLVFGGVGTLAARLAHAPWLLALLIGFMLAMAPYMWVRVVRRRRMRRFETQFPEAVDLMSRSLRAGHAFSTAIKMVADEMADPMGKEFRRVFEEQNLGLPMRSALMGLLDRVDLVDLKLFVVAVNIQRQSGGSLSEILDKIAYTIRERFRILRQLRVHTAQARLTGIILTALPPVAGLIIYTLNFKYMSIIFTEDLGIKILVTAGLMQILGFFWIRKIVNIEV